MYHLLLVAALAFPERAATTVPQDSVRPRRQPVGDSLHRDSLPQPLAPMRVTGVRGDRGYRPADSRAATRTSTPSLRVPQAITALSTPVLRDLGITTMTQAVEYLPGITMGQGEGHRDAPTIRGQSTTADFYIDGVRDDALYFRDPYNAERVEVLKGPSGMTFGRGGAGGVVNRVSKRPLDDNLQRYEAFSVNSRDFSSIPFFNASSSAMPCSAAYFRTSSVIFMLQKCGPHMTGV